MPGSSLWLLPPAKHPLTNVLSTAIKQISAHFNSPHLFLPHVTLTSEISPSAHSPDPQAWLDILKLPPAKDVRVRLGRLESQDVFFKKLYSRVEKDGVSELAKVARGTVQGFEEEDVATGWVEEKYMPHCSLL
jgi:2',3'-cyclic-nucleotide 3'-phosphodiesterase